jgi:ribosome-binding protein aMBF1 (putative translation factor)
MAVSKCPLCGSSCILKIVATENENWTKVDVCEMCLTMYPRGRNVVVVTPKQKAKPKAKKAAAKPKKKTKKR